MDAVLQRRVADMSMPSPLTPPEKPMSREMFSAVVREHHSSLCAYARVITKDGFKAREVVQDAFVAAWNNIGKFDVTRDISSWLRGIVRNKWREACRRNAREVSMSEDKLVMLEHSIIALEADRPAVFDRLVRCREQLPKPLADSIAAYYDEELKSDEAASVLNINPATLRKRLERAREALRECLKANSTQLP